MQYLYKLKNFHKRQFYISSLTFFAQLASKFQKKIGDKELRKRLQQLMSKFTVLDLNRSDIEDNIQYVIGRKAGCNCFITRNTRDYNKYLNIAAVKSEYSFKIAGT